jgi:hypothetical protein
MSGGGAESFHPQKRSTGACPAHKTQGAWLSTGSGFAFGVARGPDATTQTGEERPLNSRLLVFECLLDPSILKHLTTRGQEVVRQQQNRLGRSAEFWAFVLGKARRPFPKLRNLLVVNQEEPPAADSTT